MTCPLCKAPTEHHYRPFCSKRCADQDLVNWTNGSYRVPMLPDEAAEALENGEFFQEFSADREKLH